MTDGAGAYAAAARPEGLFRLAPPRPATGFSLPAEFWSRFHDDHWEKRGAVLKQPFATPLAAADETFECLVAAGDRYRAGHGDVSLEFCIEHAHQLADVGTYLPERADGTAAGYAERMTQLLGGRKFGLVVDDFQAFDPILWLRVRDFLRGLFEETGLPGESAKATVFLGNYDSTPFGLHRGRSGNFMFVVEGQKRMRTWPDAFFRGKEDLTNRLDYQHYNNESIVLDAEPGDVIYWPSDYWHIGESVDGELSSAISIALFMDHRASADLFAEARSLVERRLAGRDRSHSLAIRPSRMGDAPTGIDAVVARATGALRDTSHDAELELRLRVAWLNHLTGFGFSSPPSPLPEQTLSDDIVVRGTTLYPIVWMPVDNDEIICSANGHAFRVAASPRILALLELLNRGAPHRVGALVADHVGTDRSDRVEFETSADDIRALLERFLRLRAITVDS